MTPEQRAKLDEPCQRLMKELERLGLPVYSLQFVIDDETNVVKELNVMQSAEKRAKLRQADYYEQQSEKVGEWDIKQSYLAKAKALREGVNNGKED